MGLVDEGALNVRRAYGGSRIASGENQQNYFLIGGLVRCIRSSHERRRKELKSANAPGPEEGGSKWVNASYLHYAARKEGEQEKATLSRAGVQARCYL